MMMVEEKVTYRISEPVGVRNLRRGLADVVRIVHEEQDGYVVTLRGRPVAVIRPITAEEKAVFERQTQDAEREELGRLSEALVNALTELEKDFTVLGRLHEATSGRDGFIIHKGDKTYHVEVTAQPDRPNRFRDLRGIARSGFSTDEIINLTRGYRDQPPDDE